MTIIKMIAAALALLPLPAAAQGPDYAQQVKADYDRDLGALWDHFHRNPELSFREVKTAARIGPAPAPGAGFPRV